MSAGENVRNKLFDILIKEKKKKSKYDSRHYWNVFIVVLAGSLVLLVFHKIVVLCAKIYETSRRVDLFEKKNIAESFNIIFLFICLNKV